MNPLQRQLTHLGLDEYKISAPILIAAGDTKVVKFDTSTYISAPPGKYEFVAGGPEDGYLRIDADGVYSITAQLRLQNAGAHPHKFRIWMEVVSARGYTGAVLDECQTAYDAANAGQLTWSVSSVIGLANGDRLAVKCTNDGADIESVLDSSSLIIRCLI